ncbi:hypothetical protein Lepto7375DRAFT_7221 [Leptolyngbya sp. PCC 7375]|nr:hypothetical protein Lepto7375DRAFT_7221 [Leptolyngbya sp. PCC 7375]
MGTLIWAFGISTILVFGVSANDRMEQGLPVLPKFTGFKPEGLLPEGEHTEEVYYSDDHIAHPMRNPQTVHDPGVDEYIQEWVSAYESEGTPGPTGGYAPEALKTKGSETESILETTPETIDPSSNISGQDFHENTEIFPKDQLETSEDGPIFTFESEEFNDDEYAVFCDMIDIDGLNPKGREIVYLLWGIKPGRQYSKAMNKRNMYADHKKSA